MHLYAYSNKHFFIFVDMQKEKKKKNLITVAIILDTLTQNIGTKIWKASSWCIMEIHSLPNN